MTMNLCRLSIGKQITDQFERLDIRDGIGPRRTADRRLVDKLHGREMFAPFDRCGSHDSPGLSLQLFFQSFIKNFVNQCALAGAADPGNTHKHVQRNCHIDILQVVVEGIQHLQQLPGFFPPRFRDRDRQLPTEVFPGKGCSIDNGFIICSEKRNLAPPLARLRAHIDKNIRFPHHIGVMLDHQNGVADITERFEDADQSVVVERMKADARLVQHVN